MVNKKLRPKVGTKGMTGKKMSKVERTEKGKNDKAIKRAREKLSHTYYHGRNH
jgi:hypothetical protein